MHVSQRGFVSAEQLLVAFSVSTALPPLSGERTVTPGIRTGMCMKTSPGSVCVYSRRKTLARDGRCSKVVELRCLPRLRFRGGSRVTKLCGTLHVIAELVGTAANKPVELMQLVQVNLMRLDSIQIAPWQPRWAMLGWLTQPTGTIPCGMHQPPPRCRY